MNSRQRVCQALRHEQPDRLPKGFFATADFMAALRRFLGVDDDEQALNALGIDLRHVVSLSSSALPSDPGAYSTVTRPIRISGACLGSL